MAGQQNMSIEMLNKRKTKTPQIQEVLDALSLSQKLNN